MTPSLTKLNILLTPEQAGPYPVSAECLWCAQEGRYYRVKNVPLFIDGISFDDVISVTEVSKDLFQIENIVQRSENSTIWIYLKDEVGGEDIMEQLLCMGCGREGGAIQNFFAINVPAAVNIDDVYTIVDKGERQGHILVDYPSVRH